MVNLLRKNRKKLLSENSETKPYSKFSRYIAYRTGEIVLVVIGILIALQINTWSTQQQEHKQEVYILHRLSANLSKDINNLETKTKWIKKNDFLLLIPLPKCLKILQRQIRKGL